MISLKKFKKNNTSIEHADGRPAFFEMTMIGFTSRLYKIDISSYNIGISHFKNAEVDYISLISDQDKIGENVIKKYIDNKKLFTNLYLKWIKQFNIMMRRYFDLYNINLSNLSNSDLIKVSDNLYDLYSQKVSMPGFIDGFMFYAEKRFDKLINEFCKKNNIKNKTEILSILNAPVESSFLNEEENDLRVIINKWKINNIKKIKISDSKLKKEIEDHLFKYSWIKSSYAGFKEYTLENLFQEIRRIIKKEKREANLFLINKKAKNNFIKKYKLNKELLAIIKLSDMFIKWQDQRKQYTLTFVALKSKILKEVAKRSRISFDLLTYSLNSEIEDILNGKIDRSELSQRRQGVLFIYKNGRFVELVKGREVLDFMNQINIKEVKNDAQTIKGSIASTGVVRGVVKIVTSVKYINKLNKGDVLVAPMTRPEYLSGIRKASAIITDDGGITCHAAIVSRELHKPCIIGTKIATKYLKDGDLVEVDAHNGVIRILERI